MKIGVNRQRKQHGTGKFLTNIGDCLTAHGHTMCFVSRHGSYPDLDALFIWNGEKPSMRGLVDHVNRHQGQVVFAEHGFINRDKWQLDPRGINANSSNRMWQAFPDPTESEIAHIESERLQWRERTKIGYEKPDNYILVALQTPTDVNLTVHSPQFADQRTFIKAVQTAASEVTDTPLLFRQHPKLARGREPALWTQLNTCKFVITINSNTVHEALMAQKDCICLGPQIYTGTIAQTPETGGVVYNCDGSVKKLKAAIVMAEARIKNELAKNDPTRDMYLLYVLDREWTLEEATRYENLERLLQGKPKSLGCRAMMHPDWPGNS